MTQSKIKILDIKYKHGSLDNFLFQIVPGITTKPLSIGKDTQDLSVYNVSNNSEYASLTRNLNLGLEGLKDLVFVQLPIKLEEELLERDLYFLQLSNLNFFNPHLKKDNKNLDETLVNSSFKFKDNINKSPRFSNKNIFSPHEVDEGYIEIQYMAQETELAEPITFYLVRIPLIGQGIQVNKVENPLEQEGKIFGIHPMSTKILCYSDLLRYDRQIIKLAHLPYVLKQVLGETEANILLKEPEQNPLMDGIEDLCHRGYNGFAYKLREQRFLF